MMKFFISILLLYTSIFASSAKYKLGKTVYQETCTVCHGASGKPERGSRFIVDPRDLSKSPLSEKQMYQIIKKGGMYWGAASDIMPSFENVYSKEELEAVTYYVHKTFNKDSQEIVEKLYAKSKPIKPNQKSKMLKRGKKIYTRNCSWCHGITGHGDGEATRNPEMSIFPYDLTKTILTDKQMFLYAKYGGKFWGTHKDDMPSWRVKYDDWTLKSVIFYINKVLRNKKQNDD